MGKAYTFTRREAERIAGLTKNTINIWRHEGLLDGIGKQQPNGYWMYSREDIEIFIRADSFLRNNRLLDLAFRYATENRRRIDSIEDIEADKPYVPLVRQPIAAE